MTEVKNFSLSRLHQEEAYGFHQMMIRLTGTCTHAKVTPLQANYITYFNRFEQAIKPQPKSQVTAVLANLDAQRDVCFNGLYNHAKNMCNHFDAEKAAIARAVYDIIKTYGDITQLVYIEESGATDNLLQDLLTYDNPTPSEPEEDEPVVQSVEDEQRHDRLAFIGIRDWVDQLQLINNQFKAAFEERIAEQAANVSGLSTAARKDLDYQYLALVRRINALIEVDDCEGFDEMVAQMNELIDYQSNVLKLRDARNASAAEKEKEDAEENEQPTEPDVPADDEPVVT